MQAANGFVAGLANQVLDAVAANLEDKEVLAKMRKKVISPLVPSLKYLNICWGDTSCLFCPRKWCATLSRE